MSRDPYEVLGVAKDATPDDIRKAYRGLAKKLHPDLNPGDSKAADRFREVSAAYELLGDADKRGRFDRGEIDASGAERPPQRQYYREYADTDGARHYRSNAGFQDFGDASDLFADLFGQGGTRSGPRRGMDSRYSLELDFLEAVKGGRKRITMPDGQTLDLNIPAGVADGQVLRLKGKGMPGRGDAPAGDALVEIAIRPHPQFERRGDDIHTALPISLDEAILGGKIEVATVDGRVAVTVPKGAANGQVLRLRGKGVQRADGKHGDQFVMLTVVMPSQIDPELETFIKSWRDKHGYTVRR
ncbi:MAG: DnaJ C-terminal domain-containing protein [Alphaproteobacteria bacterium]